MMSILRDAATAAHHHDRSAGRRFVSTPFRARLATGLIMTAILAVMSPPAVLAQAAGTVVATLSLSDRAWTSMINGWGPVEKDRSNGEQAKSDGARPTFFQLGTDGLKQHDSGVKTVFDEGAGGSGLGSRCLASACLPSLEPTPN
jgi:hypothetical protein